MRGKILGTVLALLLLAGPAQVAADTLTSTHFRLSPDVTDTFGGQPGSAHYSLIDAGGEAATGLNTASGSYQLPSGYVASTVQSIQATVLTNGTVAYYPMDTNVGTRVYDGSSNANDGSMNAGVSWTTGEIGNALSFNGTSGFVDIPNSASLSPTSAVTVEAWINHTTSAGIQGIISKDVSGSIANPPYVLQESGTTVTFSVDNASNTTASIACSTAVSDGAWHHIVGTFDGTTMTIYLDGNPCGTVAQTNVGSTTGTLKIGQQKSGMSRFFKGSIDEAKIYNRALSAAEVANEYTAANAGIESAQTIPAQQAGVSQNTSATVTVRTDAAGYNLGINENHNLLNVADGITTIPSMSGTIATPTTWTEGTTTGLGFTVTSATGLEAKWSSGTKYAAIPTSATTFHSESGFLAGLPDNNVVQFRLDTPGSQKGGAYTNNVTFTATVIP